MAGGEWGSAGLGFFFGMLAGEAWAIEVVNENITRITPHRLTFLGSLPAVRGFEGNL